LTKTLKEMVGKEQLVRSKLAKELNSLCLSLSVCDSVSCAVRLRLYLYLSLIATGLFIEISGVNVPPKNTPL